MNDDGLNVHRAVFLGEEFISSNVTIIKAIN